MGEVEFIGARLDKDTIRMVEETAKEEDTDKTQALKELIKLGRKQFLLKKFTEEYRLGKCSIDKAAENVGITVNEMMQEVSGVGIKSSETIEEYRAGLKLLSNL